MTASATPSRKHPVIRDAVRRWRPVRWKVRRALELLRSPPWGTLAAIVVIGLGAYWPAHLYGSHVGWQPPQPLAQHWVNAVGIFGMAASAVGFYYAWTQLRIMDSRIQGYASLYHWIERLLLEIRAGGAHRLLFYGSTILPGNLSFASRRVQTYKTALELACTHTSDYEGIRTSVLLLPPEGEYQRSYDFFMNKELDIPSALHPASLKEWQGEVGLARDKAIACQQKVAREVVTAPDIHVVVPVVGEQLTLIRHAYFFSNGIRIVYAMPLHYTPESGRPAVEIDKELLDQLEAVAPGWAVRNTTIRLTPELIGFTTTDKGIVRAFERHFWELKDEAMSRPT